MPSPKRIGPIGRRSTERSVCRDRFNAIGTRLIFGSSLVDQPFPPTPRILFLDDAPDRAAAFRAAHPGAMWVQTVEQCLEQLEQPWDEVHLDHDLGGQVLVDSERNKPVGSKPMDSESRIGVGCPSGMPSWTASLLSAVPIQSWAQKGAPTIRFSPKTFPRFRGSPCSPPRLIRMHVRSLRSCCFPRTSYGTTSARS